MARPLHRPGTGRARSSVPVGIVLCTLFFATGASALIFETLWFRQAGLAFGNSVWASSLVLAGFMAGLGLGNAAAARFGGRFGNPVRAYALAEGAIGVTGVALVFALPATGAALAPMLGALAGHPALVNALRLLVAFVLLCVPSTAMGLTLPLLTRALSRPGTTFGSVLGFLYAWNTLGAVVGVLASEMALIGALGIRGAALAAGSLNLLAAGGSFWLSRRVEIDSRAGSPVDREPAAETPAPGGPAGPGEWMAGAFLAGFSVLALEVIWFRLLLLFVLGHAGAFAVMLAVVLLGIALGGLAGALWLRRRPDAPRFAASVAFAAGLACVATFAALPALAAPYASRVLAGPQEILALALPLMLPVCVLSGLFFTLAGQGLRGRVSSATAASGLLTLANTAGAVLGSLCGGFLFLPVLGMERSLFAVSLVYAAMGLLLAARRESRGRIGYASGAACLAAIVLFPFGSGRDRLIRIPQDRWMSEQLTPARPVAVREGQTETIIWFECQELGRPVSYRMLTNAWSMSGTTLASRRYMKLYVYLPAAVHPRLRRALLICYGVGNTAKALVDTESLERIDVVDISRDILSMDHIVYPDPDARPLKDPRVRVHVEDGRNFLQSTGERYDLITAEPPPPFMAGVVNLYTREYFQQLHDRLADGGIVTYWLPLHDLNGDSARAILRAFADVFEDASLWNGTGTNLMMVGTRGAAGPVPEETFRRQWSDPALAAEMARLGLERPEQLGALFIGDAEWMRAVTRDTPPLVDDDPKRLEAARATASDTADLLKEVLDTARARERFSRSPLIGRLWPAGVRAATLPYFETQDLINRFWYELLDKPAPDIEDAHAVLTRSPLKAPVLWLLGSDGDVQRLFEGADSDWLSRPDVQYHRGIGLIAERRFEEAAGAFDRAGTDPHRADTAFLLRFYALCMADRTKDAEQLAQTWLRRDLARMNLDARSIDPASLPAFWQWASRTFGVRPLPPAN